MTHPLGEKNRTCTLSTAQEELARDILGLKLALRYLGKKKKNNHLSYMRKVTIATEHGGFDTYPSWIVT